MLESIESAESDEHADAELSTLKKTNEWQEGDKVVPPPRVELGTC